MSSKSRTGGKIQGGVIPSAPLQRSKSSPNEAPWQSTTHQMHRAGNCGRSWRIDSRYENHVIWRLIIRTNVLCRIKMLASLMVVLSQPCSHRWWNIWTLCMCLDGRVPRLLRRQTSLHPTSRITQWWAQCYYTSKTGIRAYTHMQPEHCSEQGQPALPSSIIPWPKTERGTAACSKGTAQ